MKGRKKQYLILFILILSLFFLIILSKDLIYEEDNNIYKISVIIRSKNSESWMITKEGIYQAASDLNVDINFITLSEENNLEEQNKLIRRELNNGIDALIIAPVNSEKMSDTIKSINEKIPVVLIESTIQGLNNSPYISCDNYLLGKMLADEIIRSGNYRKKIAIINSSTSYNSVRDRYRGFEDGIKESKNSYELIDVSGDGIDSIENSKKIIKDKNIDVVVTLEPAILERFAQAKKELISEHEEANDIEVYGVGSTSKIIALLEENIINSIIVQNEFNVGYLGVQSAVDLINGDRANKKNIDFSVITKRNMYSDENQRLLFPFVR